MYYICCRIIYYSLVALEMNGIVNENFIKQFSSEVQDGAMFLKL